jgi:hypothetical protein
MPLWNDNHGTIDRTKGVSVSKKLRHINMRELAVRLYQKLGYISVMHIEGKKNVADIFTKEIKEAAHFRRMAFTLTTPRLLANWNHETGESIDRLPREERGVLDIDKNTVSTVGGANNLAPYLGRSPAAAPYLGSSPVAVAAAARAVASWAGRALSPTTVGPSSEATTHNTKNRFT